MPKKKKDHEKVSNTKGWLKVLDDPGTHCVIVIPLIPLVKKSPFAAKVPDNTAELMKEINLGLRVESMSPRASFWRARLVNYTLSWDIPKY